MNPNGPGNLLNLKNIIRALTLLVIIFFFLPNFIVSCSTGGLSDEDMVIKVSGLNGTTGIKEEGEKLADGNFLVILLLIIPIAIIVVTFIKNLVEQNQRLAAIIIAAAALVNFIGYQMFKSGVRKQAQDNYCEFKTTGVFVINMIVHILIILAALPVILNMAGIDMPLPMVFQGIKAKLTGGGMRPAPGQPQQFGAPQGQPQFGGQPQQQFGGQPQQPQFGGQPQGQPQPGQFDPMTGQPVQPQQPQAPQQFAQQPQAPQQPQMGQFDPMTGQPVQPQQPQAPQQFAQQPQAPQGPQGPQQPM